MPGAVAWSVHPGVLACNISGSLRARDEDRRGPEIAVTIAVSPVHASARPRACAATEGRTGSPAFAGARGAAYHDGMSSADIDQHIANLIDTLRAHPLYEAVRTEAALRTFMERHVVCVWDFMSLVKSLHRDIVGWTLPWVPPRNAQAARLLNEIVLDEESDTFGERHLSHFELYLVAMGEVGADTGTITRLVERVRSGAHASEAAAALPAACVAFLRTSLALLEQPLHARAAAFYYGRELTIPAMFMPLLERIEARGLRCDALRGYLVRHIESDGNRHGPLAWQLLDAVCGGDAGKWREARAAAVMALEARLALWNAIRADIAA